jgi:hypothetical protein
MIKMKAMTKMKAMKKKTSNVETKINPNKTLIVDNKPEKLSKNRTLIVKRN